MPVLFLFLLVLSFSNNAAASLGGAVGSGRFMSSLYVNPTIFRQGAQAAGAVVSRYHPAVALGTTILGLYMMGKDGIHDSEFRPRKGGLAQPGWVDPDTPPGSVPQATRYCLATGSSPYYDSTNCSTNYNTVASTACSRLGYPSVNSIWYSSPNYIFKCNTSSGGLAGNYQTAVVGNGCPSGYAVSGSTCVLSEGTTNGWVAWPVQPDHNVFVPDYTTGSTWQLSPRQTSGITSGNDVTGQGTQTVTGTNPTSGQKGEDLFIPRSDGGVEHRYAEQYTDANGNTGVSKGTVTTDAKGVVNNTVQNIYNNTDLTVVNSTTSAPASSNIDTTGLATSANQTSEISALNDIKGGVTANTAAVNTANTKLDQIAQKLTVDNAAAPTFGNTDLTAVQTSLSDNSISVPHPLDMPQYWTYAAGTCYPLEFSAGNFGTVKLDKFCQIYDDHIKGLLEFIISVWAAVYIFLEWFSVAKEI